MKNTLLPDIRSGTVVFLVALPLCLGISLACGVPLFSGIIAGVVGGIIVTLISNARYSVSGPAAGLTAIVISSIASLGSLHMFFAAVAVAGLLQIALGLLRVGNIGNFIPNAVVKGMLAGIGIILIIKQLPHTIGYDADPEGDLYFQQADGQNSLTELSNMMNYFSPGAAVISVISVLIMAISERKFYKDHRILSNIPGPLLVVTCGILVNLFMNGYAPFSIGKEHLVDLPSLRSFGDLRSSMTTPDFSGLTSGVFWGAVVTLALVASLETLLNIEAIEKLDPERHQVNSNRELIAQGFGNVFSGLAGGLPITSVIVRSSANIHAGAKTRLSILIHAILLMVCIIAIPGVLGLIPNAALAVILIFTGYKLARVHLFISHFRMGWDQFLPFIVTVSVMLLTDMLKGVTAGLVVAVIYIIRFNVRSTFDTLEDHIDGKKIFMIKLPQHVTFFNKGFMIRFLEKVQDGSSVIIDGSINKSTDKDVLELLSDFVATAKNRQINVQFVKYSIT